MSHPSVHEKLKSLKISGAKSGFHYTSIQWLQSWCLIRQPFVANFQTLHSECEAYFNSTMKYAQAYLNRHLDKFMIFSPLILGLHRPLYSQLLLSKQKLKMVTLIKQQIKTIQSWGWVINITKLSKNFCLLVQNLTLNFH